MAAGLRRYRFPEKRFPKPRSETLADLLARGVVVPGRRQCRTSFRTLSSLDTASRSGVAASCSSSGTPGRAIGSRCHILRSTPASHITMQRSHGSAEARFSCMEEDITDNLVRPPGCVVLQVGLQVGCVHRVCKGNVAPVHRRTLCSLEVPCGSATSLRPLTARGPSASTHDLGLTMDLVSPCLVAVPWLASLIAHSNSGPAH
mmetsp:Transcript_31176/g.99398  ORF Transcript_31176/g.99398 Transcript_31176/m.99398 type:complete len:203 (+) Transcript_31176:2198-2806(+)